MRFPGSQAAIPPEVLSRPDVRDAIGQHDFGRLFVLVRKWAGISFSRIAEACAIKPDRVGLLARGQGNITTYEKIVAIADGMRIPGHMLGLAARPWEIAEDAHGALTQGTNGGEAVRRRDFLRASLAGATAVAGFSEMLSDGAYRRVGSDFPAMLRSRTARLRKLDDVLGGGDTYRLYLAEYESTRSLVKKASSSTVVEKELLTILAEQAQQAGWAAFDMGDQANAERLYKDSHAIAVEAAHAALAGNALAFLAYQTLPNDPVVGVALAEQSCVTAGGQAPASVRALLHERRAWAHAVAGNAGAADAALGIAQEALAGDDGQAQPDWSRWVDRQELLIMTGRCWTELRRPLRAVPVLVDVLKDFDDTHARDKALYSSWLAESYLIAGEIEQAATTTTQILKISAGVASVRPRQRIQPILAQLETHNGIAEVDEALQLARAR